MKDSYQAIASGAVGQIARRDFLHACGVIALCGSGCASLFSNARSTRHLVSEPHPDDWRPILNSLAGAVLAFDHPQFPSIGPPQVQARLVEMFHLEEREHFASFRRGLSLFNDVPLFPERLVPLMDAERREYGASESDIDENSAKDAHAFIQFARNKPGGSFVELSLDHARTYCRLWAQSGFGIKRQFVRSAKTIIVVSAYSLTPLWTAIGYDGPLLGQPRARTNL